MKVSIIIVSWNARALLERCMPSVVATEYPNFEIILADNASDDRSSEWIAETFPSVKIVRHPENWAFAKGNNRAVPYATGDVLIFLNNDVIVEPGWLAPLVAHLDEHQSIAAVQPKLLQPDQQPPIFEYAGASGGHLDRFGFPFTRGRIFDRLETDDGQYDDVADIFWATGAALAVRRDAFLKAGGFDESFVMHMEEIDLCWRLRRLGYGIRAVPQSVVYHIGGASLPRGNPRKDYLNFRNSLLMLRKNLPPTEWKTVRRGRRVLDSIAAVRSIAMGHPETARAILQAHVDAGRMHVSGDLPDGDTEILPSYRGSIVLDHFARRVNHFSDLPRERFVDLSGGS
jgi:GT2 family glycosyltransferase